MRGICSSFALVIGIAVCGARPLTLTVLDAAQATSSYPSGEHPAASALVSDTSYWCSAGNHPQTQRVVWSGQLRSDQWVLGVKINWAYAPGTFKILASSGGRNTASATGWRQPSQTGASFVETVMFDEPRTAAGIAIVMQSPKKWRYFGINDVSLLVEPSAVMLVGASPDTNAEQCLVASDRSVDAEPCLDAIADSDGREVFRVTNDGQLRSARSGQCLVLVDAGGRGGVSMEDCAEAQASGDGRSSWSLGPAGLQSGSSCVGASPMGLVTGPCGSESEMGAAPLRAHPVPDTDTHAAYAVHDSAALLKAAVDRQASLLRQLQASLQGCKTGVLVEVASRGRAATPLPRSTDVDQQVVARMADKLGLASLLSTLSESQNTLKIAVGKLSS